jgi:hypothetical protein
MNLAICASCEIPFPYAVGGPRDCPECGLPALTPDRDTAQYFNAYHSLFPAHMGKQRRKEMTSLAKQVLTGELSLEAAVSQSRFTKRGIRLALSAADIGVLMALIFAVMFVWQWLQDIRQQEGLQENQEAKNRFFGQLLDTFEQMHEPTRSEDVWPFLPPDLPIRVTPEPLQARPPARRGNQPKSQAEISAASKSKQRKAANPAKKKKRPS